jgi:hypothetical protein
MVHKYPHAVTIYEGGPMTNLALAISLDSEFAELAQQLVFMGGSLNPETNDPEFVNNPRHEFNFWFDPEAAAIILRAPWKKMVCTPVDISIKTRLTAAMVKRIEAGGTPLAHYRSLLPTRPGQRLYVGRTCGRSLDGSHADHTKRDALYERRSGPGRRLWQYAHVDGGRQAETRRTAGGDPTRAGQREVLRNVRASDGCGFTPEAH